MPRLAKTIEEQLLKEHPEMKAQGLRPVVMWVPDTEAPGFAEEMRRQSILAANSPGEAEVLDWVEAVYEWPKD